MYSAETVNTKYTLFDLNRDQGSNPSSTALEHVNHYIAVRVERMDKCGKIWNVSEIKKKEIVQEIGWIQILKWNV